jgi:methylated-DNA-[protein]-cysteine S-methyltransferase
MPASYHGAHFSTTRREPMVLDLIVNRRKTPLGGLLLVVDGDGILRAADFVDCEDRLRRLLDQRLRPTGYRLASDRVPATISQAVDAYFDGELSAVQNIPISLDGTAFQEEVWGALRKIEPGRTVTYAGLARKIGRPQAARAVGHANAANPLCIVVPCHRLIGMNGDLTGYGGGVERKRWLLNHEAEQPSRLKGSSAEFESKNWIAGSEL